MKKQKEENFILEYCKLDILDMVKILEKRKEVK
jgi:hypothetical protein